MSKLICFIRQTPLTGRDYERFGIEILQSRGYKVTYLDISGILNPDYNSGYEGSSSCNYEHIIPINTYNDLTDYLKNNDIFIVVDLVGMGARTFFLYELLKKYNIKYASFHSCVQVTPCPVHQNRFVQMAFKVKRICKRLANQSISTTVEKILGNIKIRIYFSRVQRPAFILAGGVMMDTRLPTAYNAIKKIYAHTLDYDIYLNNKSREPNRVPKNSSVVFLDEYNPIHPDYLVSRNREAYFNADIYYSRLRKVFSYVENITGLSVKIAAHPSSRYDLHPHYFEGRSVILGRTEQLVFDAKFVLAHASTSINYAVLHRKPIIFLTSNDANKFYYGDLIKNTARQFNKIPINIDENFNIDLENELRMDDDAYKRYYRNYIKIPGTPEKPFWEIVADGLEA